MRFLERRLAASDQRALAKRERGVQRSQELQKADGQVAGGIEAGWGRIYYLRASAGLRARQA